MEQEKKRVVAVGTFDGLHLGHREVIDLVKNTAERLGASPAIVTFDCHPLEVIAPERAPKRILPPSETMSRLIPLGVHTIMVAFTADTARMTAREWMSKLAAEYGVVAVVMGYDNVFGCDGMQLNISDYQKTGEDLGIEVVKAPEIKGVSSSAIRANVSEGKIAEAEKMLGHRFSIIGNVTHGNEIGRSIGFPTANVSMPSNQLIPRYGAYEVEVLLPNGHRMKGVANVGTRPTVDTHGETPILEVHIPGYEGDLYQQRIVVEFLRFLRPEIKFASLELLREQILSDIEEVSKQK